MARRCVGWTAGLVLLLLAIVGVAGASGPGAKRHAVETRASAVLRFVTGHVHARGGSSLSTTHVLWYSMDTMAMLRKELDLHGRAGMLMGEQQLAGVCAALAEQLQAPGGLFCASRRGADGVCVDAAASVHAAALVGDVLRALRAEAVERLDVASAVRALHAAVGDGPAPSLAAAFHRALAQRAWRAIAERVGVDVPWPARPRGDAAAGVWQPWCGDVAALSLEEAALCVRGMAVDGVRVQSVMRRGAVESAVAPLRVRGAAWACAEGARADMQCTAHVAALLDAVGSDALQHAAGDVVAWVLAQQNSADGGFRAHTDFARAAASGLGWVRGERGAHGPTHAAVHTLALLGALPELDAQLPARLQLRYVPFKRLPWKTQAALAVSVVLAAVVVAWRVPSRVATREGEEEEEEEEEEGAERVARGTARMRLFVHRARGVCVDEDGCAWDERDLDTALWQRERVESGAASGWETHTFVYKGKGKSKSKTH